MDWKYLLTSFDGRINRAKFWAAIGIFIALGIVGAIIDSMLGTRYDMGNGAQAGIVGSIIALATLYFAFAVYAKRWHDRNKSGWWSLAPLIVFIAGFILTIAVPSVAIVAGIVQLVVGIWVLVELGILKGTPGANQYGPDPLGG